MLKAENRINQGRLWVANLVILLIMGSLFIRYFIIQIYNHEKYKTQAEVNRIRAVPVIAPRGLIFDRNGILITDNFPMYVLSVIPEELQDVEPMFQQIESYTNLDSNALSNNFHKYFRSKYTPVRLAKDLSFSQISALEENRFDLPQIHYQKIPNRFYPSSVRLAHILGYIKEVDQPGLDNQDNTRLYHPGDMIGWQGLEKSYESILRGKDGVQYYEVDAYGREMGQLPGQASAEPIPGKNLSLTIDLELQKEAELLMKDRVGALILSDPVTGEILSAVSVPDYSPDLFTGTIRDQEWATVIGDTMKPLLNRLINGQYPPGSTFKIITTLLLMSEGLLDTTETFTCVGNYRFGDRVFHCWNEYGHGKVNLRKAVVQSCNVYFFNAIQRTTMDDLAQMARDFGFGRITGIDLPFESAGVIPTAAYMTAKFGRRGWAKGALLNLAIGQGEILVTPMQMAQFVNMVAMHGKTNRLHVNLDLQPEPVNGPNLPEELWTMMDQYLYQVVHARHGTGHLSDPHIDSLSVSGKTGTAENPHGEPHAWFVGIGKEGDQIRSIIVLIENGGHGGEVAAPIARKMFARAFAKYDGQLAAKGIGKEIRPELRDEILHEDPTNQHP
ncbi:MAG: penicillin-binding protein 2 [FCB group bacterium]|nr:penicillin-binding protein 2 [FCB group bacterium]